MLHMMASLVYCYVGCNSGSKDLEALHVLECDTETGKAKIVQTVKGISGTTYFQLSADGGSLWSVVGEKRGGKNLSAAVRFELDGWRIGRMHREAELPCETPCHVALDSHGIPAFAAYSSGVYSRLSGGAGAAGYTVKSGVLPDDAVGPRKDRQQKAFAHQIVFTPDGRLTGVCDLGCDRVNFYGEDLSRCEVSIKADPGDGPRHALFSKCGRFLFVLNELSSTVTSYAYDGGKTFRRICKRSTLPEGCTLKPTETKAAAIKLSADGRVLMASNRGHDSIAFFDVDEGGGLTFRNTAKLAGRFPRDFELFPGEKFMVVGHKMSDEIQVYRVDMKKGTLDPVGKAIPAWRPLCFKFR